MDDDSEEEKRDINVTLQVAQPLNVTLMSDPPIGALVEISTGKGIVRFSGTTSFAPGKWVGIELFEPKGKNDGSIQGIVYFACKPLHGVFIRPSQVKIIQAEPDSQPVSNRGLTDQRTHSL